MLLYCIINCIPVFAECCNLHCSKAEISKTALSTFRKVKWFHTDWSLIRSWNEVLEGNQKRSTAAFIPFWWYLKVCLLPPRVSIVRPRNTNKVLNRPYNGECDADDKSCILKMNYTLSYSSWVEESAPSISEIIT